MKLSRTKICQTHKGTRQMGELIVLITALKSVKIKRNLFKKLFYFLLSSDPWHQMEIQESYLDFHLR